MVQIGICDDEKVLIENLKERVQDCLTNNIIFATIQTFHKGELLLYEIQDGAHFDLLLLDIEMPGINGMELAARVKKLLPDVLIIFITSHLEYALDAYELSVFRYIPKNNMTERLEHALIDAASLIQLQLSRSYIINNQNRIERIPLKNLLYINHESKNAKLVTDIPNRNAADGIKMDAVHTCYKVRKTMAQIYTELDSVDFCYIDRGCIVNLSHVMSIKTGYCILKDGTKLPVSQSRLAELKERMLNFWKLQLS